MIMDSMDCMDRMDCMDLNDQSAFIFFAGPARDIEKSQARAAQRQNRVASLPQAVISLDIRVDWRFPTAGLRMRP